MRSSYSVMRRIILKDPNNGILKSSEADDEKFSQYSKRLLLIESCAIKRTVQPV